MAKTPKIPAASRQPNPAAEDSAPAAPAVEITQDITASPEVVENLKAAVERIGNDVKPEIVPQGTEVTFAMPRVRVVAPAGPRRRAGISFGPVARDIAPEELGATHEEQEAAMKKLLADPMLSVSPIIDAQE
ncbi:MAG: hypothetical protein WCY29_13580 [Novosphingobium sp.]